LPLMIEIRKFLAHKSSPCRRTLGGLRTVRVNRNGCDPESIPETMLLTSGDLYDGHFLNLEMGRGDRGDSDLR